MLWDITQLSDATSEKRHFNYIAEKRLKQAYCIILMFSRQMTMWHIKTHIHCSPLTFCLSDYTHKYLNESGQRSVYDEWSSSVQCTKYINYQSWRMWPDESTWYLMSSTTTRLPVTLDSSAIISSLSWCTSSGGRESITRISWSGSKIHTYHRQMHIAVLFARK